MKGGADVPTTPPDPEQMFENLQNDLGTISSEVQVGEYSFNLQVTSQAVAATEVPMSGPTQDCIVLIQDIVFSPQGLNDPGGNPTLPRVTAYRVLIRPYDPSMLPLEYMAPPGAPDAPPNQPNGIFLPMPTAGWQQALEDFMAGKSSAQSVSGAVLASSTPDTTESATTFTVGMSDTWSGSVGFFGADGTGSVSDSVSVSHSQSVTIPDVAVTNQSNSPTAQFDFLIAFGSGSAPAIATTTFQATVMVYYKIPDSGQTKWGRNETPGDNNAAVFQFECLYIPIVQSMTLIPSSWPTTYGFRRDVIQVRQPFLPPPAS